MVLIRDDKSIHFIKAYNLCLSLSLQIAEAFVLQKDCILFFCYSLRLCDFKTVLFNMLNCRTGGFGATCCSEADYLMPDYLYS